MNKERLLQLAEHLDHGILGHEVFDFSDFNDATTATCGTAGCAIGECPIVWPDDWTWSNLGHPMLANKRMTSSMDSGCIWFNIDKYQFHHLFIPFKQNPSMYGGCVLTKDATRYQVAANIREFITKMERS